MSVADMPMEWVAKIHTKLVLVYGVRFHSQYAGLDEHAVRATWAKELAGVTSQGVMYALTHLPADWPPNALQFRMLCINRPGVETKALPAPKADPKASRERVAQILRGLAGLRKGNKDPRAWVEDLKARHERGEVLSIAQREMLRNASRQPSQPVDEEVAE